MCDDFDVIVAGAGPAGSSAAAHLARSGHQVLMLEKSSFPRDKACGDGVTRTSVNLLSEMGFTDELDAYPRVEGVSLINARGQQRDRLYGSSGHGYVVPRIALDQMSCNVARLAGVTVTEDARVIDPLVKSGRVCGVRVLHGGVQKELRATFVVAADGGTSRLAGRTGLKTQNRWSTGFAIRGYFGGVPDVAELFHVFVPLLAPGIERTIAGYGWVFPLEERHANIGVGFFPAQEGDLDLNLRAVLRGFLVSLTRLDPRFGDMTLDGRLRGAPLPCGFDPGACAGPGIVLVGDAAGLVDPFSGEGIDTALESGRVAAQVLDCALALRDPHSADLREYGALLDERYGDRFKLGQGLVKTYGFMWKLLDSTVDIPRPLFSCIRESIMNYGVASSTVDLAPLELDGHFDELGIMDDIQAVRHELRTATISGFPLLGQVTSRVADPVAQGLRSSILLLCHAVGRADRDASVTAATAIELACLAILVQDDVLDQDPPMGRVSAEGVQWGNLFAVTAANDLLTRSYRLATSLGPDVSTMMSRASASVCIGKLREFQHAGHPVLTAQRYVDIVGLQTGTTFALACRVGAWLGHLSEGTAWHLARYGWNLGVASRLMSDLAAVLDDRESRSDSCSLEPDRAILSFPLVLALNSPAGRDLVNDSLAASSPRELSVQARALARRDGSLEETRRRAQDFADRAVRVLSCALGPDPERRRLARIAQLAVHGA